MTTRRVWRRGLNRTTVPSPDPTPKDNLREPTTLTRLRSVVRMTRVVSSERPFQMPPVTCNIIGSAGAAIVG